MKKFDNVLQEIIRSARDAIYDFVDLDDKQNEKYKNLYYLLNSIVIDIGTFSEEE